MWIYEQQSLCTDWAPLDSTFDMTVDEIQLWSESLTHTLAPASMVVNCWSYRYLLHQPSKRFQTVQIRKCPEPLLPVLMMYPITGPLDIISWSILFYVSTQPCEKSALNSQTAAFVLTNFSKLFTKTVRITLLGIFLSLSVLLLSQMQLRHSFVSRCFNFSLLSMLSWHVLKVLRSYF